MTTLERILTPFRDEIAHTRRIIAETDDDTIRLLHSRNRHLVASCGAQPISNQEIDLLLVYRVYDTRSLRQIAIASGVGHQTVGRYIKRAWRKVSTSPV